MSEERTADATRPDTASPPVRVAFIVSHTHWDREWYNTFPAFRARLIDVVTEVLDRLDHDPAFEHFLLDGQSIVLEDVLEIAPELTDRVRRHVSSGSLSVGPFYVLPDAFLIGGESHVRNLLFGRECVAHLGPVQTVGYMPDSFGHVAQMPQLLRSAGIDSFVYTRGDGDEIDALGDVYTWAAPNGDTVLAVHQRGGYCNGGGLGLAEIWHAHTRREVSPSRAVETVGRLLGELASGSNRDVVLISNGCDHFPPQRDLGAIRDALTAAFPEVEFRHRSLRAFVDALETPRGRTFVGELRGGKRHPILSGVWSSRMPLKQLNDHAETWLGDRLEPLLCHAWSSAVLDPSLGLVVDRSRGLVDAAWRALLRNHPHDSICGCSVDEVHEDMIPRFRHAIDTAETLTRRVLTHLTPTFARREADDADTRILVANTLPERRSAVVRRLVVLGPPGLGAGDVRLVDEDDRPVPVVVVARRAVERFWGIDYRTLLHGGDGERRFDTYLTHFGERILVDDASRDADTFLTIEFLARDLPPTGHRLYALRTAADGETEAAPTASGHDTPGTTEPAGGPDDVTPVVHSGATVSNRWCRATLRPDGRVDLVHVESGRAYPGLNRLEDTEDVGDEYDYSPAERSETVDSCDTPGTVCERSVSPLAVTLATTFDLDLPAAITPDRRGRASDRVRCPVTVELTLDAVSPFVRVRTTVENRARDHRLRAVFPTPCHTETVSSDGHFLVNERSIRTPDGEDWVQPPPTTVPQRAYSIVADGDGGLAVFNRGLPECEATPEDGGVALRVTLLRAVEWLSRDDFPTRRFRNAGPTVHTPGAQCLGSHTFEYALMPFSGDAIGAGVHRQARRHHVAPLSIQGVADGSAPGAEGPIALESEAVAVSAIKLHQRRATLVVRAYNLTGAETTAVLRTSRPVRRAWNTTILEDRIDEIRLGSGPCEIALGFGPHQIRTLEIAFDTGSGAGDDAGAAD